MNELQENILDHYKNPRNFGHPNWDFSYVYESKNISCGDEIKLYVQMVSDRITNLAFEGEGCSIAIASASILTEEFKSISIPEILKMSNEDYIKNYIGFELTPSRQKCALLVFLALKKSISK